MTKTINCFLQTEEINRIEFRHNIETQLGRKSLKRSSSLQSFPTMPKYRSALPPLHCMAVTETEMARHSTDKVGKKALA